MEIEIEVSGKKELVKLIDPTGEDQIYYWKQMNEIDKNKTKDEKDISDVLKVLEVKDGMIIRLCPRFKSVEEVRKISLKEKYKIMKEIDGQIMETKFTDSAKNSER